MKDFQENLRTKIFRENHDFNVPHLYQYFLVLHIQYYILNQYIV